MNFIIVMKHMCILVGLFMLIMAQSAQTETDSATILDKAQTALAAKDYKTAFDAYLIAAQNDHNALAQFNLGLFYQNGWGRDDDNISACQWFEKSAEQGIPAAQHFAGLCLEQGLHRTADPSQAASFYQKAAEAGHFSSYCDLGRLYMTGKGVEKNPTLALELCQSAAMLGSPSAQIQLGKFWFEGDPSIRNLIEAMHWFESAARQQSPEAFYYLGLIVQQGLLSQHTPDKARQLFEQAASLKFMPAYFETGKQFFYAEPDSVTGHLSAEHLAKAYLWLSVTIQRSENTKEVKAASSMLQQILKDMPETWLNDLNQKITSFLLENH